ncbi:sensor histidine kinase [Pseudoclavibacter sp. VKM Ac-2867]|uniref:sensor histidine kinase n=1 Tax=Pseudoclavibacter sp. VKM Ac-2867 TaxID=2783829 RepID=UPI00188AA4DE|nr:histidine kinase [Pseudoclavibacter sp. VKM Ac-2867]MBF4459161.1 sensor histidine kinase [Pseudoclavibacter sp. VKM Ac-2867]
MTTSSDGGRGRLGSLPARLKAAPKIAEFVALAFLLVVDFELAARSAVVPESGAADALIAGAMATAFVALVVAALVVARGRLPVTLTVLSAFAVSLLASGVAASIGFPWFSLTESAALAALTVFGVRAASPRGAIAVGGGALVVALAITLLRIGVDEAAILLAILIWGCAVIGGVAARFVRLRRESALETARRTERLELARELHDVVAHQVTGIVVQAQAALAVARDDPERTTEALTAIEAAGAEALTGMRRMVGAIRDEHSDGKPASLSVGYGLADIPTLVERFDPARERTTLHLEDADAPLPPGVGESVYRVVREALTNARKHAPAGTTAVSVRVIDAELVLEIENDGVPAGAREDATAGFGLTGMSERVAALGGVMTAGAGTSDTWTVAVSLPLETQR